MSLLSAATTTTFALENMDNNNTTTSTTTIRPSCLSPRQSIHSQSPPPASKKLVYESPRLELSDDVLFPPQKLVSLRTPTSRWKFLSQVAGKHKQDLHVLRIRNHHSMTPQAFQYGMPIESAKLIHELHIPYAIIFRSRNNNHHHHHHKSSDRTTSTTNSEQLVAWLKVIRTTFPNLKRLYIENNNNNTDETHPKENDTTIPEESSSTNSKDCNHNENDNDYDDPEEEAKLEEKVQRLFILQHIPGLEIINGTAITNTEQRIFQSPPQQQQPKNNVPSRNPFVELAKAKVFANNATAAATNGTKKKALLDDEGDDDVEEEDDDDETENKEKYVPKMNIPKSQDCSIPDVSVEVDLDGRQIEYEAVESSVHGASCEWSAACGSLNLSYFSSLSSSSPSKRIQQLSNDEDVRRNTKNKFHLHFRRHRKQQQPVSPPSRKLNPTKDWTQFTYDSSVEDDEENSEPLIPRYSNTNSSSSCFSKTPLGKLDSSCSVSTFSALEERHELVIDSSASKHLLQCRVLEVVPDTTNHLPLSPPPPPPPPPPSSLVRTGTPPRKHLTVQVQHSKNDNHSDDTDNTTMPEERHELIMDTKSSKRPNKLKLRVLETTSPDANSPSSTMTSPPPPPMRKHWNILEQQLEKDLVLQIRPTSTTSQQSSTSNLSSPRHFSHLSDDSPTTSGDQSRQQRIPASESLTSPFPMQFRRLRIKQSCNSTAIPPPPPPPRPPPQIKEELTVSTEISIQNNRITPLPPPPPPSSCASSFMETIEIPIPLTRTQSSPSRLLSNVGNSTQLKASATKGELPPPCPTGRRNAGTIFRSNSINRTTQRKLQQKRGSRWRDKMSARSTSIMDDEDDDENIRENSDLSSEEESVIEVIED